MEFIIVPGTGLIRAASRLVAVLAPEHDALILGPGDFAISATPPPSVGIILFGADAMQSALGFDAPPPHVREGNGWGWSGNQVFFLGQENFADPKGALTAVNAQITDIEVSAKAAFQAGGPATGAYRAGQFLDPQLRVPAQTIAATGGFAFTMERMVWERQYTLSVIDFLANGLDDFLSASQP